VRKEVNAIRRLAERRSAGEAGRAHFRAAVSDFYREHAQFLSDRLRLPLAIAREYCDRNAAWVADAGDAADIGREAGLDFDRMLIQGMQWLSEKAVKVVARAA
jgi:hypothetical protein